jgi:alpha-ketoglutarate-dependent taurine dioxygenase
MSYPHIIDNQLNQSFSKYVNSHKQEIFNIIHNTGAILFKNFNLISAMDFAVAIKALHPELQDYIGGDSPRNKILDKVYTSTNYPPEETISMHHEKSYSNNYPRIIYFFCEIPPQDGGETPIADARKIYKQIKPKLIEKFQTKKIKYIMNLHHGIGLGKSWKEVFESDSKQEAEKQLKALKVKYQWKEGDSLRVEEVVNPIIEHPVTKEKIFFSQVDQWHPSNLGKEAWESMKEIMSEEDFYHYCTYGDDSTIDLEDIDHIRSVANAERVFFRWQKGDILMLDNVISMHGRSPFRGSRKILVSMA